MEQLVADGVTYELVRIRLSGGGRRGLLSARSVRPLGEVRIDGATVGHEPITPPWGAKRGCVHIDGDVRIAQREELADNPPGDLLQAGPLLVSGGRSSIDGEDREGFSTAAAQFDSDITIDRHPRCGRASTGD